MRRVLQDALQTQETARAEARQPDPPANTPGSSQPGIHRVAAKADRHPRGERPAEQPPCRQHRGNQPGHLSLSPSRSKARGTGATETLDGAQEVRHASRAQASLRLSHLALDSASSGEGRWTRSCVGAEAAGRCSPASLALAFLPPPGGQALAHWHNHLPARLLRIRFRSPSLSDLK